MPIILYLAFLLLYPQPQAKSLHTKWYSEVVLNVLVIRRKRMMIRHQMQKVRIGMLTKCNVLRNIHPVSAVALDIIEQVHDRGIIFPTLVILLNL